MIRKVCFIAAVSLVSCVQAQKGCTDKKASNYDPGAKDNDGSCLYNTTSLSPVVKIAKLSDTLQETSGLIWYHNSFWTINDSGNDPVLWSFDNKGYISRSIRIKEATNTDWEELTQDNAYFYIGDFGNNAGDRKDLHILRIAKSGITDTSTVADAGIINFILPDQTDFTSRNQANNNDMEACFVSDNMLHLFSKDWLDGKTRHYTVPTVPGNYTATLVDSLDAGGLITGACTDTSGTHVALTGYTKGGICFMWLLWDYQPGQFFSGNKRRIELGNALTFGQNEGICYKQPFVLSLTNEKRFTNQSLREVNTFDLYWQDVHKVSWLSKVKCYPQPSESTLRLECEAAASIPVLTLSLSDINGAVCRKQQWHAVATGQNVFDLDVKGLPAGTYVLMIQGNEQPCYTKVLIGK